MSAFAPDADAQVWLLDFGGSNSFRGASQLGPDANGNSWNSFPPTFYTANLVTAAGTTTGAAYAPISGTPGTDSFNGPLGTNVSNPLTQSQVDAAVIDAAALGLLGGSKAAAVDFQSSTQGRFAVRWLNHNLTYDATFFGSHRFAADATTYSAFSDNTYTTQVSAGTLNVGGSGVYNASRTVTLSGLVPTANDAAFRQLSFQFGGVSGTTSGYLNSMSLYGYIGYLSGGTTTLNGAPAAGYIATGTYANGDSRSVDTAIGGGSTVTVNSADGIYFNSTLVAGPGGGTIDAGVNFGPYRLDGAGPLAVTGTGVFTLSRPGAFTGTLSVAGGKVSISGSGALGSGGVALNGGVLRIGHAQAIGVGGIAVASGLTTIENTSGIDGLSGAIPIALNGGAATLQCWGNGRLFSLGTGSATVQGFNNLNAWDGGLKFDGPLVGSGTLNWYGSGTLALNSSGPGFTGRVIAGANNGTLSLGHVDALQSAVLAAGTAHTVAFAVPGVNTYALGGLSGVGSIALGGNSLAITTTVSNTFSGAISGAGGLTIAGSGVQTLTGVNTYSGTTTVAGGRLAVGSGNINASAGVIIDGGELKYNSPDALAVPVTFTAGTLSGTGQIAAAVSVGENAILSPGNSPGVLAFTSGLDWRPGGTLAWEVNALSGTAGVNWDAVSVSGGAFDLSGLSATVGGRFLLDLVTLTAGSVSGGLAVPFVDGSEYRFQLASFAAGLSLPAGYSAAAGADLTDLFSFSLANWQGTKPNVSDLRVRVNSTGSGIDLAIIPEPGALTLAAVGLVATLVVRLRTKGNTASVRECSRRGNT